MNFLVKLCTVRLYPQSPHYYSLNERVMPPFLSFGSIPEKYQKILTLDDWIENAGFGELEEKLF